MPISPIVLQRRHAELGRIRLGDKQPASNGQTRPNKLSSFRFTSVSERYIRDLAQLYGGDARAWDNNGIPSWEVYTSAKSIPVIAVKGGLSQWMEFWAAGGCIHRCDGENNVLTGEPCDLTEKVTMRVRGREVQVNPHTEAKPTTRLSLMLPELEAIGVWRLESHGWNAAAEIPAVAELAQYVGDLVPAHLHLVERRSVKDGKTSRFVVPVLDLQIGTARLREIVAEKSGTSTPELTGTERPALPAGPTPAAPSADPYAAYFERVAAAADTDDLIEIWDAAKDEHLVGPNAQATERAEQFLAAWKARAHELKPPAPAAVPDEDGVVDAVLVEDTPLPGADGGSEDAVWQQILKVGGDRSMSLDEVAAEFHRTMGMIPDEASAGELASFLQTFSTGEQVPA